MKQTKMVEARTVVPFVATPPVIDEPTVAPKPPEPTAPVSPLHWPLDNQLRKEALDDALSLAHLWNQNSGKGPKELVEGAELIYQFLRGNQNGQ